MSRDASGVPDKGAHRLLTVSIADESGIIAARQRARQLAQLLGFEHQDQVRIATATSEIARNAYQYAKSGVVEYQVEFGPRRPLFVISINDAGPGIERQSDILEGTYRSASGMGLGIIGARRLMDTFAIESSPRKGTRVTLGKYCPNPVAKFDKQQVAKLSERLAKEAPEDPKDELRQQSRELIEALDALRRREAELEQRQAESDRLNQELEETNRGVVALYAELDERASALSRANEVKTRFLSYMSHEFRTPLNSILALADLLIRRTDGDLTPEQEKQIVFIKSAARELFEMVNDLLDIAKVESGNADVRLAAVDIPKLLGALRGMMRPLSNPEGVDLVFEDVPDGLVLESDERKLSQILRNLVSNALKFTDHGEVRVSVNREGADLVFSVKDTGIGIAREDQERIFREFAQVDGPVQRKVKGTGLGLPLSRKLAELLGGSLDVESELGKGSIFRLRLPVPKTESVAPGATGISHPKGHRPGEHDRHDSVLIIDDDEVARYLIRQQLRGTHYYIAEASAGIEGLERARFDQPRLIILDIGMPDRSGFDILDELKADSTTRNIPVVIHTSRTLSSDDLARLSGHQAAILPKGPSNGAHAWDFIRSVLEEPHPSAPEEEERVSKG